MIEETRQVCPKCGNLRSVCSDPDLDWHPATATCWPTATTEWAVRRLREKYADAEPSPDALHPLDGVSVFASRVDLDDPEFS